MINCLCNLTTGLIVKADTSHETYVLLVLFHSSSFLVFSFLRFASPFVFSSSIVFSPLLLLFSSSLISSSLPFPSLPFPSLPFPSLSLYFFPHLLSASLLISVSLHSSSPLISSSYLSFFIIKGGR